MCAGSTLDKFSRAFTSYIPTWLFTEISKVRPKSFILKHCGQYTGSKNFVLQSFSLSSVRECAWMFTTRCVLLFCQAVQLHKVSASLLDQTLWKKSQIIVINMISVWKTQSIVINMVNVWKTDHSYKHGKCLEEVYHSGKHGKYLEDRP